MDFRIGGGQCEYGILDGDCSMSGAMSGAFRGT